MTWKRFLYLYETDIVAPGLKFNLGDIKIESFNNERTLNVAAKLQSVSLLGRETTLLQSAELRTDSAHTSLLLTARTKESNIFDARKSCVESLDVVVALLGNIYHPTIFDKQLYAGWDYADPNLIVAESNSYLVYKIHEIDSSLVAGVYDNMSSVANQYRMMAKLYAKAASMQISEEKFVKLWTILEIFPLETKPGEPLELAKLYELLKTVTGISQNQINKKLKINSEIYDRYRSEIVHTGSIGFSEINIKNTTAKLEAIVRVVMRHILGVEYENDLADFL